MAMHRREYTCFFAVTICLPAPFQNPSQMRYFKAIAYLSPGLANKEGYLCDCFKLATVLEEVSGL